jgi:hypothetical protein
MNVLEWRLFGVEVPLLEATTLTVAEVGLGVDHATLDQSANAAPTLLDRLAALAEHDRVALTSQCQSGKESADYNSVLNVSSLLHQATAEQLGLTPAALPIQNVRLVRKSLDARPPRAPRSQESRCSAAAWQPKRPIKQPKWQA